MSSIKAIVEMAHAAGKTIILNTAPVQPVEPELLAKVSIVTPNEVEASIPVSYTHLDVYKRQVWFLSRTGVAVVPAIHAEVPKVR